MTSYARIQVKLSPPEWRTLIAVAEEDCREPRQQARYLLREAIRQKMNETVGQAFQGTPTVSESNE